MDQLNVSPNAASKITPVDLIVETPGRVRKRQAKKDRSVVQVNYTRASKKNLSDPAAIPPSLVQLPAITQGDKSGGEGSSPPGTNNPPREHPFSFAWPVYV